MGMKSLKELEKMKKSIERRTPLRTFVNGVIVGALSVCTLGVTAEARDLNYGGDEAPVYVKSGEPTQVTFPGKIEGGFKRDKNSNLVLERQDNFLIIFAKPQLGLDGESIIVHLDDKRSYALRMLPATADSERDVSVKVLDSREAEVNEEDAQKSAPTLKGEKELPFAPPSTVSGLMRELVLVAEFGKQKGIPGYRRSNKFSGEAVLNDGAMEATIDEIFMGTDLWGYVLSVENKMNAQQRVNPATFRLDGTRAVSASRWDLAPQPVTDEQRIANGHKTKLYIITAAKRR